MLERLAQYEMAFRMQTSVPEVTDVSDEPESTFESYGSDSRERRTRMNTPHDEGFWIDWDCDLDMTPERAFTILNELITMNSKTLQERKDLELNMKSIREWGQIIDAIDLIEGTYYDLEYLAMGG